MDTCEIRVEIHRSFHVVVGGSVIFFRCFSSWKGINSVNVTPNVIQVAVILSDPLLGAWLAVLHVEVGRLDGLLVKLKPTAMRVVQYLERWELTGTVFVHPLTANHPCGGG